ncbi:hypothetical protein OIDMADRAFT_50488 [Oidiodendron maius Zn]|uniref:Uncharacterized protein n=1 Tax=Oidiodendron maius (strain Zn) TaxID=913774 RepID=A0A0C3H8U5_OIDMZ|nr:hypothetical protein OIDMADRAFT_50488 [Oidiodendron maius Zn]
MANSATYVESMLKRSEEWINDAEACRAELSDVMAQINEHHSFLRSNIIYGIDHLDGGNSISLEEIRPPPPFGKIINELQPGITASQFQSIRDSLFSAAIYKFVVMLNKVRKPLLDCVRAYSAFKLQVLDPHVRNKEFVCLEALKLRELVPSTVAAVERLETRVSDVAISARNELKRINEALVMARKDSKDSWEKIEAEIQSRSKRLDNKDMNAAFERAFDHCNDEMINHILFEEVLRPPYLEILCRVAIPYAEKRKAMEKLERKMEKCIT